MEKKSIIKKEKIETSYHAISRLGIAITIVLVFILLNVFSSFGSSRKVKAFVLDPHKVEIKKVSQPVTKVFPQSNLQKIERIPILMYHYVEYIKDTRDTKRYSLNILPHIFDEQVKTLKEANYTFLTARDVGLILNGEKAMPDKPVVLTFDDGHWDLDTDVLPILKKYDVYATAYIIPGLLGGSDYLTDSQMRDVIQSGLVEIAAHTIHHVSLKGLPIAELKKEVEGSKQMLENTYHLSVVSFAYPNGSFDEAAENMVKDSGFSNSVTTVPGIMQSQQNRYYLYRLRAGARTGKELLKFLAQDKFKPW